MQVLPNLPAGSGFAPAYLGLPPALEDFSRTLELLF